MVTIAMAHGYNSNGTQFDRIQEKAGDMIGVHHLSSQPAIIKNETSMKPTQTKEGITVGFRKTCPVITARE